MAVLARVAAAALLASGLACGGGSGGGEGGRPREPAAERLFEASANLDAEDLRPILERVSRLVESGFGNEDVGRVVQAARSLGVGEDAELSFTVRHAGGTTPLKIQLFQDDVDAPEIAFFTRRALADAIHEEIAAHMEAAGK